MSQFYTDLTPENFESIALNPENKLVVVDFWGIHCSPCRQLAPIYEKVAEDLAGQAIFCKFDCGQDREIPMLMGVRSIPSILIFKNGQLIDRTIPVSNDKEAELKEFIGQYL